MNKNSINNKDECQRIGGLYDKKFKEVVEDILIKEEIQEAEPEYENHVSVSIECEPDVFEQSLEENKNLPRRRSLRRNRPKNSISDIDNDLCDETDSPLTQNSSSGISLDNAVINVGDNPWPYIEEFFSYIGDRTDSKSGKQSILFQCMLCFPSDKIISANRRSLYNLKAHIGSIHPDQSRQFEVCIKERDGRKRKYEDNNSSEEKFIKKQRIVAERSKAIQDNLNELVSDLIIEEMLPLKIVESPAFKKLITVLQPSMHLVDEKSLADMVDKRYEEQVDEIRFQLASINYIALTVDCWSYFNTSYLGVSAHWIDLETLARKSFVLACRHIKKKPTCNSITEELEDIYTKYQIKNKICRITTDNGSNFVCPCRLFFPKESVNNTVLNSVEDFFTKQSGSREEFSFHHIREVFDNDRETQNGVNGAYSIPEHFQCAAHILNLVATTDCVDALENGELKKLSASVMTIAQKLWERQSGKMVSDELIEKELGELFIVPCLTNWKSLYNALLQIDGFLSNKEKAMGSILIWLNIAHFSASEKIFIKEYVSVMRPIARALDLLQREATAYMGLLLPTLKVCKTKLKALEKQNLQICGPLVLALLNGIEKRFESILNNEDFILGAAFHPSFKLDWVSSNDLRNLVRQMMVKKLSETFSKEGLIPETSIKNEKDEEEEDYFACFKSPMTASDTIQRCSYEQIAIFLSKNISKRNELNSSDFPSEIFKSIFIELNTPIPCSVAVDKIFFNDRDFQSSVTAHYDNLRPNNEKCLLLKLNKIT